MPNPFARFGATHFNQAALQNCQTLMFWWVEFSVWPHRIVSIGSNRCCTRQLSGKYKQFGCMLGLNRVRCKPGEEEYLLFAAITLHAWFFIFVCIKQTIYRVKYRPIQAKQSTLQYGDTMLQLQRELHQLQIKQINRLTITLLMCSWRRETSTAYR